MIVGAAPTSTSSARLAGHPGGYLVQVLATAPSNPSQVVAIADYYPDSFVEQCERIGEYVLTSEDGGRTWRQVSVVPWIHPCSERNPSTGETFGFAATTGLGLLRDGKILLAVSDGAVYLSEDGGIKWKVVKKHIGTNGLTPIITDRLRPSSAWICSYGDSQSGLLRTQDGGRTWKVVKKGQCLRAAVQPGGRIVLVRGEGVLFRSTDRGARWKRVSTCTTETLKCWAQSIIASDASQLYFDPSRPKTVIGISWSALPWESGVIYLSSDAGVHWRPTAFVAGLSNRGYGRIYNYGQYHRSHDSQGFNDAKGRRLHLKVSFERAGIFRINGALVVGGGSWDPKGIYVRSSNHGRSWTMMKTKNSRPYTILSTQSNAATRDEILAFDEKSPAFSWHFRMRDSAWRKIPLGIPAPTTNTKTTS